MAIVTKRNAVVGWITLKVGKKVARKKANQLSGKLPFRRKSSKN